MKLLHISEALLSNVTINAYGFDNRFLINTSYGGHQFGNFCGMEGRVTVDFVPWFGNKMISDTCRLHSNRGQHIENILQISYTIEDVNTAFNFDEIFLSLAGPLSADGE